MLIQSYPVALGWTGGAVFVFELAITIYFADSSAQVIHNSTTIHKYKKDQILKSKNSIVIVSRAFLECQELNVKDT